jgi:catechol 2,3-dioxygenase-like lactoylglutathione lyase family enzyme
MTALVNCQSYMALNVKDIDACIADAQNVAGLRLVERSQDQALLTSNTRRAELILHSAHENSAGCIGLEAPSAEAVAETARCVRKEGLRVLSEQPSLPCIEHAVTFATSEGHVFEVHTAMPHDQPRRYPGPGIHPRRIDHVNLGCADPQKTFDELHRTIGLKLSERTGGCELMWARAGDGRHHTVAFAKGKPGLHHFCWEFAQFSDFMRLGDVLDTYDRLLVWGPGRHGAGDNLFAYYVDPAGFLVECSSEMEVIDDSQGFEPRVIDVPPDLSNPKVVNRWGALPPLAWIQHHSDFAKVKTSLARAS